MAACCTPSLRLILGGQPAARQAVVRQPAARLAVARQPTRVVAAPRGLPSPLRALQLRVAQPRVVRGAARCVASAGALLPKGASASQELDAFAVVRYGAATALQLGVIVLIMAGLDAALLPHLSPTAQRCMVGAWFAFNSLRSRTFSPLNAQRPTLSSERSAIADRRRPAWMPPPLVFPIVWTSMAVLRTVASVIAYEAVGSTLLAAPLVVFMLHLCVGDTWNSINNVEQRLGVAVPGVLCVWTAALAATFAYGSVSPLAARVLCPLNVWLTIAALLVFDIWRLNNTDGRYPLWPTKA